MGRFFLQKNMPAHLAHGQILTAQKSPASIIYQLFMKSIRILIEDENRKKDNEESLGRGRLNPKEYR